MGWSSTARDLSQLLMEVAWVTVAGALIAVLMGAQSNPVPLWIGIIVAALGFGLRRYFVPDAAPAASARFLMAAAGGLTLYVAIGLLPGVRLDFGWPVNLTQDWLEARHVIIGGLLLMVLWLRGTTLGQEEASVFSVTQSFRVGVAIVVIGAIAHILLPVPVGATSATFLFFGSGMAGFALTHIVSMGPQESAGLSDWPKTAAITVGGIVIGSVLLAIVAEGDVGRFFTSILRLGAILLTPVVIILAWALGLVVEAITFVLLFLLSIFREGSEPVTFTPMTPNFSNVERSTDGSRLVPFWVLRFLSWATVLLAISGVAYILWRSFSQRSRTDGDEEGEERERLEAEGDFGEDLAEALASLMDRFGRRRQRTALPVGDPNDPRAVALGAYQSLLVLAADGGIKRFPWQTPEEFEKTLRVRYGPAEVGLLTRAFTRARYGFIAPNDAEAMRIREAWARLRAPTEGESGTWK